MEALSWLSILTREKGIESVVDLRNGKELKIFLNAFNREGFFHEGFPANSGSPASDPIFIPLLGVNLSDPSGVPVAGRPDEDLGMNTPEHEFFSTPSVFRSGISKSIHDSE